MRFIIEITDLLPDGRLETQFVVSVYRDVYGKIETFVVGDRERALAFDDNKAAQEIANMAFDFEIDYSQPTFVGLRKIPL
jgi:hypothetical protein